MLSRPDREMIRPLGLPAAAQVVVRSPYFPLALILALIFLVYAPVLNDWFKSDDFFYLRAAQVKAPSQYVIEAFDFRDTSAAADGPGGHYRPLYTISILAEGELFGLNALPYHLVNLLIHLANATLVWLIARKITQRPLIAHIAALVFALHPSYAMVGGVDLRAFRPRRHAGRPRLPLGVHEGARWRGEKQALAPGLGSELPGRVALSSEGGACAGGSRRLLPPRA